MSYKVKLTDTAKQDLREITFWLAERSGNIDIAKRFLRELQVECKNLAAFPKAGSLPKDRILRSAGYRFKVYKEYLIFYIFDEEREFVTVMAIFNAKKDYMRVMRNFI